MAGAKKELDTELNLISFISLLSVLICSLLLTAVWVHIGSLNVKQAVGGQASSSDAGAKKPSVWANLEPGGHVQFILRDFPRKAKKLNNRQFKGIEGKIDEDAIGEYVEALRGFVPGLRTVLIVPKAKTVYEEIIHLMDHLKSRGIIDLGVVPL